jgi:hypothetical protein
MSFVCPNCLEAGSLEIIQAIQLPEDACSGDLMLQVVECVQCQFTGLAVYAEERHSALDTIDWKHIGYRVAEPDLEALRHLIRSCPAPDDPHCTCATHTYLSRLDTRGCWQGLVEFEIEGDFVMRILY